MRDILDGRAGRRVRDTRLQVVYSAASTFEEHLRRVPPRCPRTEAAIQLRQNAFESSAEIVLDALAHVRAIPPKQISTSELRKRGVTPAR